MNKRIVAATLIAAAVAFTHAGNARADGGKEENEQKIDFKAAPKVVRKTLKREAGDETIKTVDKEKLLGKTVYEADVKIDGHNYEIVVSEAGLLLSKKLDEEDAEKKESTAEKTSKGESSEESPKKESSKKASAKKDSEDKAAKDKGSEEENEDKGK